MYILTKVNIRVGCLVVFTLDINYSLKFDHKIIIAVKFLKIGLKGF